MKNILLVEHQRLVSEGIHALLAMEEDLSINQTVSDEEKFYRLLRSYSYDLILMNLHIPHFNAIKATVHVKKHYPDMKVVHLTDFAEDHLVVEAILSGARSEEHTSELQSRGHLVCRLLLAKKKATLGMCTASPIHLSFGPYIITKRTQHTRSR